jgi:hypothetical protein
MYVGTFSVNHSVLLNEGKSENNAVSPHAPRGPFLTSAPASGGDICPLGGMVTPSFTPGVNTLYCLEEWRGEQRISPPSRG